MLIGVVGGGQLGRMLALAGAQLGMRLRFLDADPSACARQTGELIVGDGMDAGVRARFAAGCDAITYEFENAPLSLIEELARTAPLAPPAAALAQGQDRLLEKSLFRELGIPTPAFAAVDGRADLDAAVSRVGLPAVLKSRRLGYDGKGQCVLRHPQDVGVAWATLGDRPLLLEAFVPFDRELSILAVRGRDGATAFYPLVENEHREGILRVSRAPAPRSEGLTPVAQGFARRLLERLDYVGVLALELFERGGELLANEFAPRVHNSGHWTIEGAVTSQFENHLRAVAGWPLGAVDAIGHSVMLNLVGSPFPRAALDDPRAHVHWYGKEPRPDRKVGHVTICGTSAEDASRAAARVEALLAGAAG